MSEIKIAKQENIQRIALCHRAAFPDSLSTALGLDYVSVMLSWYLSNENTFLFFVDENNHCLGYCGGMVRTKQGVGSASSMAQYSFNSAVKSFMLKPWLLLHPEIGTKYKFIFKNIANRFLKRKDNIGDAGKSFEPYAGLVVIGVDPYYQGKGYGSLLLKEFENISRQRGLRKLILTVNSYNTQAINSYSKNGWKIVQVKEKSTSMEKLLV